MGFHKLTIKAVLMITAGQQTISDQFCYMYMSMQYNALEQKFCEDKFH